MKGGNSERLCLACRKLRRKEEMIRFVRIGSKAAVDLSGKIQARGAYVCRDPECMERLKEKHFLRKALRTAFDEEALSEAEVFLRAHEEAANE